MSAELISTKEEDFLESDRTLPGQNYCCISFVSPDDCIKQKELFMFHKFMTQACGEYELNIDEILKKSSEDLKNKVCSELRSKLKLALKYNYDQFKDKYDDFKYKYGEELDNIYNKQTNFKTSVRGVKVRGVFDTYQEAENRAKILQKTDRSFHVFVGQVGFWLPWDPNADKIGNEEYGEDQLNTLMKEYRANEVRKDMFYEERKREKKDDALKERMAAEEANKKTMEEEDPWMQSRLGPADTPAIEGAEANTETTPTPDAEANTETTPTAEPESASAENETK
jgi:hypothetical protein